MIERCACHADGLEMRYLKPMRRGGEPRRAIPDMPKRPNQAYDAVEKMQ